MKKIYLFCKKCDKVTVHDATCCQRCGETRAAADKRVPNVFPKGRGF